MKKLTGHSRRWMFAAVSLCILSQSGCAYDSYIEEIIPYVEQLTDGTDTEQEEAASEEQQESSPTTEQETVREESTASGDMQYAALENENYAWQQLGEEEQILYQEVYAALSDMQEEQEVSTTDPDMLNKVFSCVMNDHPELFYVEGYQYTKYSADGVITRITFYGTYSMSREEAANNRLLIDAYAKECLAGIKQNADEYDKVKYLYDYLIEHTDYDVNAANNQNICSVFIGHASVCQGYAKSMQYLLQKAGIFATLVTGYTNNEGHAWNLVRVNGEYYYLDATWGDVSYTFTGENSTYEGEAPPINYDYFLVTTKELAQTHRIDNVVRLPECSSNRDNYYVKEGLYFETYDEEKLRLIFNRTGSGEHQYVTIKCSNEEVFKLLKQRLIDEQEVFDYIQDKGESIAYTDNSGQWTLSFWI